MPFRHTHFLKPEFFPVPCQFGISAILVFRNHQSGSGGSVILKQLQVRAARTKGRRQCVSLSSVLFGPGHRLRVAFGGWGGCNTRHLMTGRCWKAPLLSAGRVGPV